METVEPILFEIRVKVQVNEDHLNPIVAWKFRDVKGTELTGTNTMLENIDTSKVKKGDVLTVSFKQRMYLQPGQYLLSL